MTDDELRTLVASLATSTASNAAEARANTEAIRELRISSENQAEAIRESRASAESRFEALERQGRTMLEGLASLQASAESQARSIEFMREGMSHNTETMARALELAASSQRTAAASQETAAAAMELSAQTSRNLDRLENDIADLQQMMGIVIRDNQADRARIQRIEGQE